MKLKERGLKKGLKIAISGRSGCGNTTVSTMIADALDYRLINYTFHTLADEMEIPFKELCRLAENDPQYDYKVDERQIAMTEGGDCVLGSRLAIWLCKDADLKVFLTASPEVRSGRIKKREGGSVETVIEETRARDERDHKRYLKLYDIDNEKFNFADLVIDTEKYTPEEIRDLIIKHAEKV
ncbi:MAG: cytidylate kinase family protein [Spirochaetales bacterium]|nr:cytidylate kinase family protein [Spirochaetales bacterium]